MKQTVLIVGALAACVLVTGSITQGAPDLSGPGMIRLTTRQIGMAVDNRGPAGRSAGDVVLIRELLFNKGIRKTALGHADIVCTYTGSRSRQCSGTYFLPRGKIVVAGSLRYRNYFKLAVVGGTDLYDNVRGSLTVTTLGLGPRRELIIFRL